MSDATNRPDLLNAKELMARIGLGPTRFNELRRMGKFKHLETTRPFGQRRYSKVLVDRYVAGESTVTLVRRAG